MKLKILENRQKKDIKKLLLQIFIIAAASLVGGAAFKNFFAGSDFQGTGKIIPTGLSGLSEIIRMGFLSIGVNIPTAVIYISINAILFIFALRIMGWRFLLLTGIGMSFYTIGMQFVEIPALINAVSSDKLLACVVGSAISGLMVGVAMKFGGSTGGSDIVGIIINRYFPRIKTGYCVLMMNVVVLVLSVIVGGFQTGIYALVVAVVNALATNLVLDGSKRVVAFYIICDKDEEIAEAILQKYHRGVTRLDAVGMFSKKNKAVLLCLVPNDNSREMKKLVNSIDEEAFVFSAPVTETMGDGNFMKEMSVFKNKVRKAKILIKNQEKCKRHKIKKTLKLIRKKKHLRFIKQESVANLIEEDKGV